MATFPVLGDVNARRYFLGHAISQSGTWMNAAAMAWLVLDLTGSATAVGIVVALQTMPVLLLGPWAGSVVDRLPRYRVLLAVQVVMGLNTLLLGALTVIGAVEIWMVDGLALAYGLTRCLEIPARQSFLGEVVGRDLMRNAITLQAMVNNGARVLGPVLSGLVIALAGTWLCFVLNAVSYAAILALFLRIDRRRLHRAEAASRAEGTLRVALAHCAGDPDVRLVLSVTILSGVFLQQYQTALPVLARHVFDASAGLFGLLMAGLGAGAVIGGLIVARTAWIGGRAVCIACICVALGLSFVAVMPVLPLAVLGMVLVGISNISLLTTANSSIQLSAGAAMQGRLVAIYAAANVGGQSLGAPLMGWLCDQLGARSALLLTAGCGLATGVIGLAGGRGHRVVPAPVQHDEQDDEQQGAARG